jgi:hypothetical protein
MANPRPIIQFDHLPYWSVVLFSVGENGPILGWRQQMSEAQNREAQSVVVDAVSTNPKPRREKIWNTWDNWEEMRAH